MSNSKLYKVGLSGAHGSYPTNYGDITAEEQRMVKSGKFIAFGTDFAMRNLISTTGYLGVFLGVTGLLQKVFEDILTNTEMHSAIMEEMNPIFPHHFTLTQNGASESENVKVKLALHHVVRKFVKGITQSENEIFICGSTSQATELLTNVEKRKTAIEVIDVLQSQGKEVLAVAEEINAELQEIAEQEVEVLSQIDQKIHQALGNISDNTRSKGKEVDVMNVAIVEDKS